MIRFDWTFAIWGVTFAIWGVICYIIGVLIGHYETKRQLKIRGLLK
jgi:uncharacterized protein YneF (UPF0154 family)